MCRGWGDLNPPTETRSDQMLSDEALHCLTHPNLLLTNIEKDLRNVKNFLILYVWKTNFV